MTSAALAVLLLAAGIVLTVGGLRGPEPLLSEPAVQDGHAAETAETGETGETWEPVTSETSGDVATPGDPVEALSVLVERRASAFAGGDPAVLEAVDVEDSPAMAADRESVGSLQQSGRALRDLSITIRDARLLTGPELENEPHLSTLPAVVGTPATVDVAVVRATAQISSYTDEPAAPASADPPDAVAPSLMAAGRQELAFVLWNTDDGWRIHSVVEPPS